MKQIFEIRANAIYSASQSDEESQKLKPEIEMILVHTDGKKYEPNPEGSGTIVIPVIQETRFFCRPKELDGLIEDLQKWKLQLAQIDQNCNVINGVIEQLNKPAD